MSMSMLLLFSGQVVSSSLQLHGRSTLGFPVPHHLSEFAQVHVHWIGDAIQPSHSLLPSSPSDFSLSQHEVFSSESAVRIRWPKYWSFSFSVSASNEYSGLISFRIDWFWSPCSSRDSQMSYLAPQFENIYVYLSIHLRHLRNCIKTYFLCLLMYYLPHWKPMC